MAPVETRGVAQIAFDDAGTHAVELTTLREHAPNTELTAGARLIVVHDGTSTAHYLIAVSLLPSHPRLC